MTRGSPFPRRRDFFIILLISWPLYLIRWPRTKIRRYRWKRQERRLNDEPPTLTPRKQALTLPLKDSTPKPKSVSRSERQQWTSSQEGCVLFKLPAEVRDMVYEEYVGRGRVEIDVTNSKQIRALRMIHDIYLSYCFPVQEMQDRPTVEEYYMNVLPLLLTCRRIYTDLISLIYSLPIFHICSPYTLIPFLSTILPIRSTTIRHLVLDFSLLEDYHVLHPMTAGLTVDLTLTPDKWPKPHSKFDPKSHFSYRFMNDCKTLNWYNVPLKGEPTTTPTMKKTKSGTDANMHLWGAVCQVLGNMYGLRDLRVIVQDKNFSTWESEGIDGILEPLSTLRSQLPQLRSLQVEIMHEQRQERQTWKLCQQLDTARFWRRVDDDDDDNQEQKNERKVFNKREIQQQIRDWTWNKSNRLTG